MDTAQPQTGLIPGLTASEVVTIRGRVGENRLPVDAGVAWWHILLQQFASPLVYVILAAAAISIALGEIADAALILVVVVIDVILGFIQEYQAQRTYGSLRSLLKPTATVIRDGRRIDIEAWELVPGDVMVLGAGDRVAADGNVLHATRLSVDEAVLTGESEAVTKSEAQALDPAEAREHRVFMGTTVLTGRAHVVVTATGASTELGAIATSLGDQHEAPTPLQVRLAAFSRVLTMVVVACTAVILLSGLMLGRPFLDMLRIAIILAVAAVPVGLIIAVTVILVVGMRKVLRRQGLVKRLLAVETLGSVTVICTDKTGTLTEGRMRVVRTDCPDEAFALRTMVLCNDLEGPVDSALWDFADGRLQGGAQSMFDATPRTAEELFTSESKQMIVVVTDASGAPESLLKGAPENVLRACALPEPIRLSLEARVDEWAAEGLRLLALASRPGGIDTGEHYRWDGLVALVDPVREGVPEAVHIAQQAGIDTKMITGDYRRTAEAIARTVGIPAGTVLEGPRIETMSDAQLASAVHTTSVFARIRPQDKLRIVRALQGNGEVTAMIGDGVNDAPALLHADIGVVVGTATDVAKESADLILLDNDFATVVAAIEEGRVVFDNIRKVVAYVLSNSFAELLTIFIAMLLGWPAPLLVAQILWIHLICDGPLDIVLGFEPKESGVMLRRPRRVMEPVLQHLGASLIAAISLSSALFALGMFGWYHLVEGDTAMGRSLVFASFAVNSMVYIFAYRSLRFPLHRMAPLRSNRPLLGAVSTGLLTAVVPFLLPPLGERLGVVPLGVRGWLLVTGFAAAVLAIVELAKVAAVRLHPDD